MADWQGPPPITGALRGAPRTSLFPRTGRKGSQPFADDSAPGICRICRGEGTLEEPLFHPCRCSGSIQHVHQDCLMEWLSHSQKKYCELCKTSFRFTKFYNPSMPTSLPVSVFFRQLIRYFLQNSLGWLRAIIAISFWVSWLPWFMRRGWESLFWISQESWGSSTTHLSGDPATTIELSSTLMGLDVCPASPLFAPTTTSAESVNTLLSWWESQPLTLFLLRTFLRLFGLPVPSSTSTSSSYSGQETNSQSLLGDVQFLRRLTRSYSVNQAIISVFEGQIITIVVIVSFILVILVRDYVVQQQPEVNMRAGFEEGDVEPMQAPMNVEHVQQEESDNESEDSEVPRQENDVPAPSFAANGESSLFTDETEVGGFPDSHLTAEPPHSGPSIGPGVYRSSDRAESASSGNSSVRPTPESSLAAGPSRLRPSFSPERHSRSDQGETVSSRSSSLRPTPDSETRLPFGDGTFGATANDWFRVSSDGSQPITESHVAKGKGKETLVDQPEDRVPGLSRSPETEAGPSRPRSVSDGPQIQSSVNPLANNTWSLADIPSDSLSSEAAHHSNSPEHSSTPLGYMAAAGGSVPPPPTLPEANSDLNRRFSSVRDQMEANEELYQPPLEGRIIRIPSASPASSQSASSQSAPAPAPQDPPVSFPQYVYEKLLGFMWDGLTEQEHEERVMAFRNHHIRVAPEGEEEWIEPIRRLDPMEPRGVPIMPALGGNHIDQPPNIGVNANANANPIPDDEDGAAAVNAMEPDAIEDMEDFEGIMELLGMRGPITNLFQNVIFCAVLVQTALFLCVFTPFNIGRITIWAVAKPSRIIRVIFEFSKLMQDCVFFVAGLNSWLAFNIIDMFVSVIGGPLRAHVLTARKGSWTFFIAAAKRILDFFVVDSRPAAGTGMQNWSALSHHALLSIKDKVALFFVSLINGLTSFLRPQNLLPALSTAIGFIREHVPSFLSMLVNPSYWVIDLGSEKNPPLNLELAAWPAADITWAILAGYITMFTLAALYVNSDIRFVRGTIFEDWEAGLVNSLQQASGILKVITVISIEMLVFPLYCGLLLDIAVLPLFADATVKSRLLFTYNNPWTSIFVHWFVGTGYMFHFALFVSMCRKIMRPGVLYFIRDPDDPEFHPVRDVLERNLMTQLRKILFSAFVYGTLVIVCLGGVVWGLGWVAPTVLPIHYSSNEPVLEFPVDLLFYNFFMPLAFRLVKPGDGLQAMYRWCFRKSARVLRLTYFLFGERRIDEEGTLHLPPNSPHKKLPIWRQSLLGLDPEKNNVIPKSWNDIFDGIDQTKGKSTPQEIRYLRHKKARLVDSGQLVKDGRFVRAPASDRVKIPKGRKVFLDVDERGRRTDGMPNEGLHSTKQFQMVYLPPHLLTRVFLFILCIWTFAAVTGLGLTIIPLVLGRMMFKMALPEHVRTNDIYAFCIGIHVLGFLAYSIFNMRGLVLKAKGILHNNPGEKVKNGWRSLYRPIRYGARLIYAYSVILIACPLVLATLVELYIALPTHTYINPPNAATLKGGPDGGHGTTQHNIRIVESWTLGLLYMRLAVQLIDKFLHNSRFALAMRSVLRHGWLDPNVSILTRAFVAPGLLVFGLGIFAPPAVVSFGEWMDGLNVSGLQGEAIAQRIVKYRQSYPVVAIAAILLRYFVMAKRGFNTLKIKIRDDAYLMGERLQNYDGTPPEAPLRSWPNAPRHDHEEVML